MFVTTNTSIIWHKNHFCHDESFVVTKKEEEERKKSVSSRQTRFSRDKTFVVTKVIHVAAPANNGIRTVGVSWRLVN